jgi:hypothetical protein
MTVITFPGPRATSQPLPSSSDSEQVNFNLLRLLETEFPGDAVADESTGILDLSADGSHALDVFFRMFGLHLPSIADADATHALWHLLRYEYGRIVRVALQGRDPKRFCPGFTAQELTYGQTVAQGELIWAAKLARPLLGPKGFTAFLHK